MTNAIRTALLVLGTWLAMSLALADGTSAAPPQRGQQLEETPTAPPSVLPPGASLPDPGPSRVVFPPQRITIRFDHELHAAKGQKCRACHPGALTSTSVSDRLLPGGAACDACHMTEHRDLTKVAAGPDARGQCAFCHEGHKPEDGNRVARMSIPRANMVFDHKKHADRNIGCQQCHGDVEELGLATRDQMPRMRGCFGCHQRSDAASQGDAKSACETCHVRNTTGEGGRIRTTFAEGVLTPPSWLRGAAHGADFIERHKSVAANDSQFCASCHKEEFCTACHDGRVRPRSVHPSDYLSMHPIEALQASQRCQSCHREQSFCLGCHQRVGVSMSGPPGARDSGRFHPPKLVWSDAPRKPGHHAQEAMRNLNACVSCHIERDCVVCHGGQGIGGGFNPHPASFASGCASQLRRNPRPCLVCHEGGAGAGGGALTRCR